KSDGTVVAWGYDYYGQTDVPAGLPRVTAISAGFYHTVAIYVPPVVVEGVTLSRKNNVVTVKFNIRNTTVKTVSNISINSATLGGANTFTLLPITYAQLKAGAVKMVQVKFQ